MTEHTAELVTRFTRVALETPRSTSGRRTSSSTPPTRCPTRPPWPDCDGLLLLGGGDVDGRALRAGRRRRSRTPTASTCGPTGTDCPRSAAAIAADLPVLGICRGAQLVNVAYGGTIIPDIDDYGLHRGGPGGADVPGRGDRSWCPAPGSTTCSVPTWWSAGPVTTRPSTRSAQGLVVSARAHDGIVEGFEDPRRWLVGVQWHPEDDDGPEDDRLRLFGGIPGGVRPDVYSEPRDVAPPAARVRCPVPSPAARRRPGGDRAGRRRSRGPDGRRLPAGLATSSPRWADEFDEPAFRERRRADLPGLRVPHAQRRGRRGRSRPPSSTRCSRPAPTSSCSTRSPPSRGSGWSSRPTGRGPRGGLRPVRRRRGLLRVLRRRTPSAREMATRRRGAARNREGIGARCSTARRPTRNGVAIKQAVHRVLDRSRSDRRRAEPDDLVGRGGRLGGRAQLAGRPSPASTRSSRPTTCQAAGGSPAPWPRPRCPPRDWPW